MSGAPYVVDRNALIGTEPAGLERSRLNASWYDALASHRIIFPSLLFLIHFALVQSVAMLAFATGSASTTRDLTRSRLGYQLAGRHESLSDWFVPLIRWDGIWYSWASRMQGQITVGRASDRFGSTSDTLWPLLPWVMHQGSRLTDLPPEIAGFVFINACFAGALIALYALIGDTFGLAIARRSLWCLILFPLSFFFQALYTEAPFLLFAALCLLASRKGWWLLAGIAGLLATLTRSHGIVLILPMLVLFAQQMRPLAWRRWVTTPFILLPLLGPVIDRRQSHHGLPTLRVDVLAQQDVLRSQVPFWRALDCAVRGCDYKVFMYGKELGQQAPGIRWNWLSEVVNHPSWQLIVSHDWRADVAISGTLGLVATIGVVALMLVGITRLPLWLNVYTIALVILALIRTPPLAPFDTMPRFALILFPLAIVLAMLLEDRLMRALFGGISITMLVLLTMQYANWYWVS